MTLTREKAQEIISSHKLAGSTLTDVAKGYANAKTRKAAIEYLTAKAAVTKRDRWLNAHKAAVNGDDLRMAAYAAEGREATNAAWAAVRAAEASAAEPTAPAPKQPPKSKAKKPTAPKPNGMDALADDLLAMDEAAFTALFARVMQTRLDK